MYHCTNIRLLVSEFNIQCPTKYGVIECSKCFQKKSSSTMTVPWHGLFWLNPLLICVEKWRVLYTKSVVKYLTPGLSSCFNIAIEISSNVCASDGMYIFGYSILLLVLSLSLISFDLPLLRCNTRQTSNQLLLKIGGHNLRDSVQMFEDFIYSLQKGVHSTFFSLLCRL